MGRLLVELSLRDATAAEQLGKFGNKEIVVEIKKPSKKRSIDSNSYLWVLLEKIAAVVKSDKDRVYLDMLERYGSFVPLVLRPNAVERMKREWRLVKEIGEVNVDGEMGVQILCFYGSHGYDQREMNRLIEGVVTECHDLGIETMTDAEIKAMNERWAT